jgi:glycosyltransferase involved in cell wall biosynthesis
VTFYNRSELSSNEIFEIAKRLKPDIAYVPNWYDKGYLKTCRHLRSKGIPVVAGLDNQWKGTIKQYLGIVLMRVYLKRMFSHMWVAGPYQYMFARKLGYPNYKILFDLYSADTSKFLPKKSIGSTNQLRFLYVGRLEKVKGIEDLLEAWSQFRNKAKCTLTIIGDGSLKSVIEKQEDIISIDFLQPKVLASKIRDYDCFILPSRFEPYGVVIHEFCSAGLILLASDACGSSPLFVKDGYNGYTFKANNYNDLLEKMAMIANESHENLTLFKNHSVELSKKINPAISANSFLSAITK